LTVLCEYVRINFSVAYTKRSSQVAIEAETVSSKYRPEIVIVNSRFL